MIVCPATRASVTAIWVGMATTVLLPALRRLPDPDQRTAMFQDIESRFGPQARLSILVAGMSGLSMLVPLDIRDRFTALLVDACHGIGAVDLCDHALRD